jgi:hypothetical protein
MRREHSSWKKGDPITVTISGRRLQGVIEVASSNGLALAVFFDEGVPLQFGIHESGRQCVSIFKLNDGSRVDAFGNRLFS